MRTAPALVLAGTTLLALVGCVPDDDPVIPDPLPSSTPIFASDEEALAAAEEAYGAYLAVSDQISMEAGAHSERIAPFVTDAYFDELDAEFTKFTESGVHTDGATTFDGVELQQYVDDTAGSATISVYLCLDVANVRVLDSSGADVTPAVRQSRLALEVRFEASVDKPVLVDGSEVWSGADFCAQP